MKGKDSVKLRGEKDRDEKWLFLPGPCLNLSRFLFRDTEG